MIEQRPRIYLDSAATAPLLPEVLEAMRPFLTEEYGNANALYREGVTARQALETARESIAAAIGASPIELIFTSGGTEANNAAIVGIVRARRQKLGREKGGNHIICSAFEHHAVLEPVKALKQDSYEVTLVKPRRDGFIHTEDLEAALRPNTLLVSVMTAQNEIGTMQPIRELAATARQAGVLFHTDAVQAMGKLPFDVKNLDVDAASFSAHKLGGPKGMGALYLRRQTPFATQMRGGGQEAGRRSGTQNIAGAVGFAKALEIAVARQQREAARVSGLRDRLAMGLTALDNRISLTVAIDAERHLPGLLAVLVEGQESETLILHLDQAGFAVSGGSACSTGSLEPSHVLTALGIPKSQAYGALRLSLGADTTEADVDALLGAMAGILKRI